MYRMADGERVNILGWKARMADGRVFSSRDTTFANLPNGILLVSLFLDKMSGDIRYRHIYGGSGNDWFFYDPILDVFGRTHSESVILEANPNAIIKTGSSISAEASARLDAKAAAVNDRDF